MEPLVEDSNISKYADLVFHLSDTLRMHGLRLSGLHLEQSLPVMAKLCAKHRWEEVHRVLDWLREHAKDQYTPRVSNVTAFSAKFLKLQEAMNRTTPKAKEVSPEAWAIVNSMNLRWPSISMEVYASFVQACLDGYNDFLTRLNRAEVQNLTSDNTRERRLVRHLMIRHESPKTFTQHWLEETNRLVWKYARHEPIESLDGWAPRLGSERFERIVRGWAYEYNCDHSVWKSLRNYL